MKIIETKIPEVKIIIPTIFKDERGFFCESFNQDKFNQTLGLNINFVQDNQSSSILGVLRGLHYQISPYEQGKLVRVVKGKIFDVAVDLRVNSPTFGKWVGEVLSDENHMQLWIPAGFAHGFLTLDDKSSVLYKTTSYYHSESERSIKWNDKDLNIQWPIQNGIKVRISDKDKKGSNFKNSDYFNI
jgi:dTDP-4-dehydrorhamnose 3,5-epimerase